MKVRSRSKPARKAKRGCSAGVVARGRGKSAPRHLLTLQADCTLAEADGLKRALCALAEHPGAVTLDAAALQRIDTAALQLLAAFVRDRRLAGRAVQWRRPAAALEAAARLLGMDSMLQLGGAGP